MLIFQYDGSLLLPKHSPVFSPTEYANAMKWGNLSSIFEASCSSSQLLGHANLPTMLRDYSLIVSNFGTTVEIKKIENITDKNDQVLFDKIYTSLKANLSLNLKTAPAFKENSKVDFVKMIISAGGDDAGNLSKLSSEEKGKLNDDIKKYFKTLPPEEKEALNEIRLVAISYALFKAAKAGNIDIGKLDHLEYSKPSKPGEDIEVIICASGMCSNFHIATSLVKAIKSKIMGTVLEELKKGPEGPAGYFLGNLNGASEEQRREFVDANSGSGAYDSIVQTVKAIMQSIENYRAVLQGFMPKPQNLASNLQGFAMNQIEQNHFWADRLDRLKKEIVEREGGIGDEHKPVA